MYPLLINVANLVSFVLLLTFALVGGFVVSAPAEQRSPRQLWLLISPAARSRRLFDQVKNRSSYPQNYGPKNTMRSDRIAHLVSLGYSTSFSTWSGRRDLRVIDAFLRSHGDPQVVSGGAIDAALNHLLMRRISDALAVA